MKVLLGFITDKKDGLYSERGAPVCEEAGILRDL